MAPRRNHFAAVQIQEAQRQVIVTVVEDQLQASPNQIDRVGLRASSKLDLQTAEVDT